MVFRCDTTQIYGGLFRFVVRNQIRETTNFQPAWTYHQIRFYKYILRAFKDNRSSIICDNIWVFQCITTACNCVVHRMRLSSFCAANFPRKFPPQIPPANSPRKMEACNFSYNFEFQLIICIEHGYYIDLKSLKQHLRVLHAVKSDRLRAAVAETAQLHVRDLRHTNLPIDSFPIPYLKLDTGYRCGVVACSGGKNAVSKHKRTVEKHLVKKHNIGYTKNRTKPTFNNIQTVCVQSFCNENYYRPFTVRANQDPAENETKTPASPQSIFSLPANNRIRGLFEIDLAQKYEQNQRVWETNFDRFQLTADQYADQTLFWLRTTGINRWIRELNTDKKILWELLHAVPNGKLILKIDFTV